MTLAHRQTRIFVPPEPPFEDDSWAAAVLGAVVAPALTAPPAPAWFWFSRYVSDRTDTGDSDLSRIPDSFAPEGLYRSLRLRYAVAPDDRDAFERRVLELVRNAGAALSDFRDYGWVDDLGGDRFVGEERSAARREARASLVAGHLHALARLTLDCVAGPDGDGRYRFESNDSEQNPHGSTFESLHHLFCNMTGVPTYVLVRGDRLGTHWNTPAGTAGSYEVRVRF